MINVYQKSGYYPFKHASPDLCLLVKDAYIYSMDNFYYNRVLEIAPDYVKLKHTEDVEYKVFNTKIIQLDNWYIYYYRAGLVFSYFIYSKLIEETIVCDVELLDRVIVAIDKPIIEFASMRESTITFTEGYNIFYDAINNAIQINCVPGEGKGYYKPEYKDYNFVRKISGVSSNNGNININSKSCVRVIPEIMDNSLYLKNDGEQCVDCEEIRRLWQALSKIIDDYKELAQQAQDLREQLNNLIQEHNNQFRSTTNEIVVEARKEGNLIIGYGKFKNNSGCVIQNLTGSIQFSGDIKKVYDLVIYFGLDNRQIKSGDTSVTFSYTNLKPRDLVVVKFGLWPQSSVTITFEISTSTGNYVATTTV